MYQCSIIVQKDFYNLKPDPFFEAGRDLWMITLCNTLQQCIDHNNAGGWRHINELLQESRTSETSQAGESSESVIPRTVALQFFPNCMMSSVLCV